MANELDSALFLTRKAPSLGTLISMFSAWLLDRFAWYHLEHTKKKDENRYICWFSYLLNTLSTRGLAHCKNDNKCNLILLNSTHPRNHLFLLLPFGRHKWTKPTKTSRHSNSYFPLAINFLNSWLTTSEWHFANSAHLCSAIMSRFHCCSSVNLSFAWVFDQYQ